MAWNSRSWRRMRFTVTASRRLASLFCGAAGAEAGTSRPSRAAPSAAAAVLLTGYSSLGCTGDAGLAPRRGLRRRLPGGERAKRELARSGHEQREVGLALA